MGSLLDLIKAVFGPKAISSTIGTRTNVVRFPGGKLDRYLRESLNIEAASDEAALSVYRHMEQLVPYVSKMNDSERIIFEGNLGRLRNKLEAMNMLPKQEVVKEGEVVGMGTKQKITGEELKKLTEEQGTKYPPTTVAGQLEVQGKRLEKLATSELDLDLSDQLKATDQVNTQNIKDAAAKMKPGTVTKPSLLNRLTGGRFGKGATYTPGDASAWDDSLKDFGKKVTDAAAKIKTDRDIASKSWQTFFNASAYDHIATIVNVGSHKKIFAPNNRCV